MKSFLALVFTLTVIVAFSQTKSLPVWYSDAFNNKGLNKKYDITSFIKPSFIEADFNGDGSPDVAALVIEKKTKRKAFC